jgi:hypothetical protein
MKIAIPTVGDALYHYAIGYVAAVEKEPPRASTTVQRPQVVRATGA